MKVRFYTSFSKRTNSTKQISAEVYTELDITWKEPTSIEKPIAIITGNHFNYTYCYVPSWNRYYFVDDITTIAEDLTQITMSEDYLATWKSAISSTVAYIAYSSTGWNKDLTDNRALSECTRYYQSTKEASSPLTQTGDYILSVINNDGYDAPGIVHYYQINKQNMNVLTSELLNPNLWSQILSAFQNPMDFIQGLHWVPYTLPINSGNPYVEYLPTTIRLADNSTLTAAGRRILEPIIDCGDTVIQIQSKHNDYRDSQPYTSFTLYLPGIGLTDLNANDLYESQNVTINTLIDFVHGDLLYRIKDDDGNIIKTANTSCRVEVPIAHTQTIEKAAMGAITSLTVGAMGAGISALAANPVGAAGSLTSAALGVANNVLQFNQRSTSFKGSDGGRAIYYDTKFKLFECVQDTCDPDSADYIAKFGRPVGVSHAISNHSGYVQCVNASVNINALSSERETVNGFLNGGFYYE